MTTVRTGARLHFGLFNLPGDPPWAEHWRNSQVPARYYGGLGAMIDDPGFEVSATPDQDWTIEGPQADRVRTAVDCLRQHCPHIAPHHIHVHAAPQTHAGFGSGTQLAMAVAAALVERSSIEHLAVVTRRGLRSAIGIYGFATGKFLVDIGKRPNEQLGRCLTQIKLPMAWRFVVATPKVTADWSGERERLALARVAAASESSDPLYRLALESTLYASSGDVSPFGAVLTEFNARVGDRFASVQGGRYATPKTAALVAEMLANGAAGAGQTSWGPTAWGLYADRHAANYAVKRIDALFPDVVVRAAKPLNCGATFTVKPTPSASRE